MSVIHVPTKNDGKRFIIKLTDRDLILCAESVVLQRSLLLFVVVCCCLLLFVVVCCCLLLFVVVRCCLLLLFVVCSLLFMKSLELCFSCA